MPKCDPTPKVPFPAGHPGPHLIPGFLRPLDSSPYTWDVSSNGPHRNNAFSVGSATEHDANSYSVYSAPLKLRPYMALYKSVYNYYYCYYF